MASVLKFLFNIAFSILQALFGGYVLSCLWAWFITPKFASAPALGYKDCVGLMIVVGFFTSGLVMSLAKPGEDKDTDAMTMGIIKSLVTCLIVYPLMLFTAWCWHQFIG